jgi:hypothetical protein
MNFIEKSLIIHNNKYSYEKVNYVNNMTNVIIICPIHGDFMQFPKVHLRGNGCSKCSGKYKKDKFTFINEANNIFNFRYKYDKVNYINNSTKVIITCTIHGDFIQSPKVHLKGNGCSKCSKNYKYTTSEYINLCVKKHGDKFDYSNTLYINSNSKIKYLCKKCNNEVEQLAREHLKSGCKYCYSLTTQKFIKKSIEIHGSKYDYSKVNYNGYNKVDIICKKHGIFKQSPMHHIHSKQGCPKCKTSKGEREIINYLESSNINYIYQKKFENLPKLRFDFYIPNYNICIEYNGLQHYEAVKWFGGKNALIRQQNRDFLKKEYCDKNKIILEIIKYDDNIQQSLEKIKNNKLI